MSDRLTELQRQRVLAQEQVAWFDREIARETNASTKPVDPVTPLSAAAAPAIGEVPVPRAPTPDPDELLKQYQGSGKSIQSEVKRGCLIYFFAAFALLTLGVTAFYFFWKQ